MLILTTGKFASYLEETKRRIQEGGELLGQQKAGCSFCFMKRPAQANPVLSNGDRKPARRLSLVWLPLQIAEGHMSSGWFILATFAEALQHSSLFAP